MEIQLPDCPKNVIFDMGNVLMSYSPQRVLDALCTDEESKEIMRRELFEHEDWLKRDRGDMTVEELHRSVLSRVPEKYHEVAERCMNEWMQISHSPIEEMRDVVSRLKAEGHGVYVLSNASDDFVTYFPTFMDPSEFDGILVSYEVHMLKPEPEIFFEALRRWGLRAEDCLFLDDYLPNVEAARAVGMQSRRMKNGVLYDG